MKFSSKRFMPEVLLTLSLVVSVALAALCYWHGGRLIGIRSEENRRVSASSVAEIATLFALIPVSVYLMAKLRKVHNIGRDVPDTARAQALEPIAPTESLPANGQKSSWNFRQVAYAFIIGFFLQMLFLPCLCDIGVGKTTFALVLDTLIAVRVLIAYLVRERGRGWVFYTVLLYTSPGWITVVARVVLGPDAW